MPLPPSPPPLPVPEAQNRELLIPIIGGPVRFVRRNRHVTVPLLGVPAAFVAAGEALNMSAAGSPAAAQAALTGTAVGAAAVAGSVWLFAPHKWTGKDGEPRCGLSLSAWRCDVHGAIGQSAPTDQVAR